MPTFKITLAYDGTDFSGWQAQPGRRTVQGSLQSAWQQITGSESRMTAASRTDAGVHAEGQVVGIESTTHLASNVLVRALNANLPADMVVCEVEESPAGFHAAHDARGKRYRYRVRNSRVRPLFERKYVWHVPRILDAERMLESAQCLVGTHDFASFQSAGSPRESTVRTIHAVEVQALGNDQITIDVEGDGFLYNMVRIIVGSLVEVGAGTRELEWLADAMTARDRRVAGKTAPPEGLCLVRVFY